MQSIDQVLGKLDAITHDCYLQDDILGVFSAVYRRTTQSVLDAIEAGRFEDARRMEQLDVAFALRYLDAYYAYRKNEPASLSWVTAFDAAQKRHLTLIQHLLLGMNAHILLDLSVAAAQVCPGNKIYGLEKDFMTINDVLKTLIDEIQNGIGKHSPLWRIIDFIGWRFDEKLVFAGICEARQKAWDDAVKLAFLAQPAFDAQVNVIDDRVAIEANKLIRIMIPARPIQWLIRKIERNPLKAIPVLQGINKVNK